jgi:osmotically-inducible protein OsmY
VRDGWVTLEGEVDWNYEREEAKWQAASIRGVIGVTNSIRLRPRVAPADIRGAIAAAFGRSALIDANAIEIKVNGSEVTLKGTVHSWAEREEAEHTVWSIPGITSVDNQIAVGL